MPKMQSSHAYIRVSHFIFNIKFEFEWKLGILPYFVKNYDLFHEMIVNDSWIIEMQEVVSRFNSLFVITVVYFMKKQF